MGRGRRKKLDKLSAGFFLGILAPLSIFLIIYLVRYTDIPISEYIVQLWKLKITFKILSLCGFVNLLIFFLYLKLEMEKAAKGVIMATLVYALLFLLVEII